MVLSYIGRRNYNPGEGTRLPMRRVPGEPMSARVSLTWINEAWAIGCAL